MSAVLRFCVKMSVFYKFHFWIDGNFAASKMDKAKLCEHDGSKS